VVVVGQRVVDVEGSRMRRVGRVAVAVGVGVGVRVVVVPHWAAWAAAA